MILCFLLSAELASRRLCYSRFERLVLRPERPVQYLKSNFPGFGGDVGSVYYSIGVLESVPIRIVYAIPYSSLVGRGLLYIFIRLLSCSFVFGFDLGFLAGTGGLH